MSISSELTALNGYILGAYNGVTAKGGTAPQNKNMAGLATAIDSIPAGGGVGIPRGVDAQGVFGNPTQNFTFSLPSTARDLGTYSLYDAFYNCSTLIAVDMSTITTASGQNAAYWAFYNCGNLASIDMRSLTTVSGTSAMQSICQGCRNLTSVNLSSLKSVTSLQGMSNAFSSCRSLASIDLSSLTTLSGSSCMSGAFAYATVTSVTFTSLTTLTGSKALNTAFSNCGSLQSLYFPALTSSSFGSYTNQFDTMLRYTSGVTVHFPSSIQSTIGSWASVTSAFGSTNGSVLFDL